MASYDWEASRARGQGAADRCQGSRSSFAGVPSLSLSKISPGGQPADRCSPEEGGLPASSPLASRPWLLPPSLTVSLEPATLLAGTPGDGLQMEGSGCVFCSVAGGVSEPRTYLANEVVITPSLTNRMKAGGSVKSH